MQATSAQMKALGVVQEGDPVLHSVSIPFNLPNESDQARHTVDKLLGAIHRIARVHTLGKGMGLAAPQIGISRASAIVHRDDHEPIVLLNPRIIDQSHETDEQYEGCLSFFDVRGLVPRPLRITVELSDFDGLRRVVTYQHGVARLVAHEIDHLYGHLYTDRMHPAVKPITVEEYLEAGRDWQYNG